MTRRIIAIIFIFVCTSVAWMILGGTIFARTERFDSRLSEKVSSTWGTSQVQKPPSASYTKTTRRSVSSLKGDKITTEVVEDKNVIPVPLVGSDINVDLRLDYRQKGLLWYSTYKVMFDGTYRFINDSGEDQMLDLVFPFPAERAIYDDFRVLANDKPIATTNSANTVTVAIRVPAGQQLRLLVGYKSQGMDNWSYSFGENVTQVRDFTLNMKTDFKAIDFPENTLSPTEKQEAGKGWNLKWRYDNLLSGFQIGMAMPEKLQPGPLAGQISFFAPVSLFFFFFLMFIITTLRGIELHPMNYFFLAAAFFAFHLLLAYTVDHISIHLAFVISSIVSIFLVVSYLRLVVGMRFAAVEAAVSQFIYLVLFSYAFFFKGFTGLAVTIGSIITLFVVMQMTGRIRWAEKFEKRPVPQPQYR
jgi:inner membrane protein involved in colicin E2 resistance